VAGRFDVVALLGKGAMGAVYRARDVVAGREVALKVLLGHRLTDKHRARFQREGEVTAALDHPGIVRVYSAGELPGEVPWITYELIDGARTLAGACDGADLERRVAWVRDAARALGVAHAQGIVHRDVKPDNLLVDAQGRLKVADFGMAWATGAERLTRTGTLVGTPYFMSPEQVAGDGQEARPPTDVWALGVTLYWALTGAYPFDAPTFDELAFQVLRAEPVAPHVIDPAVPRALSAVCLQCLEKEPGARYPDAEALAADLDRALGGDHVLARRRLSARTRRRLLLSLAPALALLLLLAAVLHTLETPPPAPPVVPVRATTSETTVVRAPSPPPPVSTPTEAPPLIELAPPPAPPPGITYTGKGAWDFAHNGLSAAMKALGGFYEDGKEGFPTDAQAAARWYQKGVDLDDSECMCELAKLLLKGKGVPRGPRRCWSAP
jgi:serine/threonine-protein kinase